MKLQAVRDAPSDQNFRAIERAFPIQGADLGAPAPTVTTLPTDGLFVGRQITYKAATDVFWLLLYTNESAEAPWNKIGGPPLIDFDNTARNLNNAAYTSLTEPLELTAPLKGDYLVSQDCSIFNKAAGRNGYMSYAVGATAANAEWGVNAFSGSTVAASESRTYRHNAIAAAAKMVEKAKTEGGECEFARRAIRLDPIRVG